jgi:hypothetical protein
LAGKTGKTNSPPPALLPSPYKATQYVTKPNRINVFGRRMCEKLSLQEVNKMCTE